MEKENIYKKVLEYLELNPKSQLKDLTDFFPEYEKNTLSNYLSIFRKQKGIIVKRYQLHKTTAFLSELNDEELAEITNTQLKMVFSEVPLSSLSFYLYKTRKSRNVRATRSRMREGSKREKIYIFLDNNLDKRTANDVFIEFPNIRPGTIHSIVIQWYEERKLSKPEGFLYIGAKWTDEKLEEMRKEHYNAYVSIMNRLNREPKPQGRSPTYEAIHRVKDNLTEEEKKELTPAKACMLVSCKPAVGLLKKIYNKNVDHINFDKTEKVIQEIEKRLFKRNMFRAYSTIVGTAIYLANKEIPQTEAYKMMEDFGGCTPVSMRNLCVITKLRKKNYWIE